MKRRDLLKVLFAASALGGARLGCYRLARPAEPDGPLSDAAQQLVARAWQGLDPARTLDCHVHVVGLGIGSTGAYVNPRMRALTHPVEYARFTIYRHAAGITDMERADQQYVERLVSLVRQQRPHGRLMILAFEQVYGEDGVADVDASEFHTPNDYVLELSRLYPDCFVACASIHPYRRDAVDELQRVAEAGAIAVKWLPNAMRMDPASPRCDAFYRKLAELGLPLLTHAGEEKAVHSEEWQKLGNPLRLRRALDAGVKVVVAHCASLGENEDLDAPGDDKPLLPSYELFARMARQPEYRGRLFGEVSALTQYNRCELFARVLTEPALEGRLVNGTDYPLPAINALIRTGKLAS
ncbi:MAG: amidohydrolase family protein, partial [Myxococcales bacterium]